MAMQVTETMAQRQSNYRFWSNETVSHQGYSTATLNEAEATLAGSVQLVQVADCEADIFELFALPRHPN